MTKARPKLGICKLTGKEGRFVKSHLIPEALTETYWRGQPLTQIGQHGRPIKRWTSWYDPALVTSHGEEILSYYDTWAIDFFRKHKMIWSSWGNMEELETEDHIWSPCRTRGQRQILDVNTKMLRLFFLSLLWRAAATSLFEFDAVDLPSIDIEYLKRMLVDGTDAPKEFYPVNLVQLSTRNMPHNMAPSRLLGREPLGSPFIPGSLGQHRDFVFYRFYFDGLTAQIRRPEQKEYVAKRKRVFVGSTRDLEFLTVPSEHSAHILKFQIDTGGLLPVDGTRKAYLT